MRLTHPKPPAMAGLSAEGTRGVPDFALWITGVTKAFNISCKICFGVKAAVFFTTPCPIWMGLLPLGDRRLSGFTRSTDTSSVNCHYRHESGVVSAGLGGSCHLVTTAFCHNCSPVSNAFCLSLSLRRRDLVAGDC